MTQKILVVDDDGIFRAIMRKNLEKLGYNVLEKASGMDVNALVEQEQPVACLIDIVMDEKEGIETIIDLGSLAIRPKIIAVSSTEFYLTLAVDLGCDAGLKKPITPAQLEATLQSLDIFPDK
ncbi:MAG: response regulator [Methylococcales bacterium]|nr:response regulator [Methylococcaceae bacterium]